MFDTYIAFARLNSKTEQIEWMNNVKPVVDSLPHKNDLNEFSLRFFMCRGVDYNKSNVIFEDDVMIYVHKMNEEEFLEIFYTYFVIYYPFIVLTNDQKAYYMSQAIRSDHTCQDLMKFGEVLYGYPIYVVFEHGRYLQFDIEKIKKKADFVNLGRTYEEAKDSLIRLFYTNLYDDKDLPPKLCDLSDNIYDSYCDMLDIISNAMQLIGIDDTDESCFYEKLELYMRNKICLRSVIQDYWADKKVDKCVNLFREKGVFIRPKKLQ